MFNLLWYSLVESFVLAYYFVRYGVPFIWRIVSVPFKLSLLHITTLFKGWDPVARAQAAQELGYGIEIGKYPQNPPERIINWLLTKAHGRIAMGAALNCFAGLYVLMLVMS